MKLKPSKDGIILDELGTPMLLSGKGDVLGFSGVVFCVRKGRQYTRRYVKSRDTRTPAQIAQRKRFADAMTKWRSLGPDEKKMYDRRAAQLGNTTGFLIFMSENAKRSPLLE